jgi:hypothetical protein
VVEVEKGDLLVEDLGQDVDTDIELAGLAELNVLVAESLVGGLEQHDLGKDLVGERAGHDERGVTGGTSEVDETALGEEDDVAAAGHEEAVDLGLDVGDGFGVLLEPRNVDFDVEVTDVADDGVVGHSLEVHASEDVTAAGGGDEDLADGRGLLHGGDLEARDGGLESIDGVDLSDNDTGTHAVESLGTALADITETSDDSDLAGNHDIGGTLDAVDERLTAAVQVVELGLGNRVVDVDGGDKEALALEHAVEVVDTGGGLLGHAVAVLEHLGVLLVDERSEVTAVVEDQVQRLAVLEGSKLLLEAPLVLLLGLALPCEDGDTSGGNGSGGVVLRGEDVAGGPGELGTEGLEGLNEDGGLDGCAGSARVSLYVQHQGQRTHVQTSSNAGALQWLVGRVLLAGHHQTRHLVLGELNLAATKGREADVSDLHLVCGGGHGGGGNVYGGEGRDGEDGAGEREARKVEGASTFQCISLPHHCSLRAPPPRAYSGPIGSALHRPLR